MAEQRTQSCPGSRGTGSWGWSVAPWPWCLASVLSSLASSWATGRRSAPRSQAGEAPGQQRVYESHAVSTSGRRFTSTNYLVPGALATRGTGGGLRIARKTHPCAAWPTWSKRFLPDCCGWTSGDREHRPRLGAEFLPADSCGRSSRGAVTI